MVEVLVSKSWLNEILDRISHLAIEAMTPISGHNAENNKKLGFLLAASQNEPTPILEI